MYLYIRKSTGALKQKELSNNILDISITHYNLEIENQSVLDSLNLVADKYIFQLNIPLTEQELLQKGVVKILSDGEFIEDVTLSEQEILQQLSDLDRRVNRDMENILDAMVAANNISENDIYVGTIEIINKKRALRAQL